VNRFGMAQVCHGCQPSQNESSPLPRNAIVLHPWYSHVLLPSSAIPVVAGGPAFSLCKPQEPGTMGTLHTAELHSAGRTNASVPTWSVVRQASSCATPSLARRHAQLAAPRPPARERRRVAGRSAGHLL